MKIKKVVKNFYIRELTLKRLKSHCDKTGISMSLFLDLAVEKELNRYIITPSSAGKAGGKKSKRTLTKEQSLKMTESREKSKRIKTEIESRMCKPVDKDCVKCMRGSITPCMQSPEDYCEIYQVYLQALENDYSGSLRG